jgi:hypothetical protein
MHFIDSLFLTCYAILIFFRWIVVSILFFSGVQLKSMNDCAILVNDFELLLWRVVGDELLELSLSTYAAEILGMSCLRSLRCYREVWGELLQLPPM